MAKTHPDPDDHMFTEMKQVEEKEDEKKKEENICLRQDVWTWIGGMLFCAGLVGLMFLFGGIRHWDAPSGLFHNSSNTSMQRFWPEPDGADASSVWYYWKLPPPLVTLWTRLFMWACYCGHQGVIWATIYIAQSQKSLAPSDVPKYSSKLSTINWISFGANIFFHLMHLLNTHTSYDALAQDVTISSSQGAVIMLINFVVLMEYRDRGLFFGWPSIYHTGKISRKVRLNYSPINLLRKYHGYAFAWAAIYTFWYHPMENTWGHAIGFVYTWMIMLQGTLMYTPLHKNPYWRVLLEMFVIVHGGIVAYQTGGGVGNTKLWPMFVFGFSFVFVLTQIFSLPFWRKIHFLFRFIPVMVYLGLTLWCYSWITDAQGQAWVRLQEIIRIPGIYYIYTLIGWGILYAFLTIEKKIMGERANDAASGQMGRMAYLIGALFIFVIFVVISILFQVVELKLMLFIQMLIMQFIFVLGTCISIMLIKRAVPKKDKIQLVQESSTDIPPKVPISGPSVVEKF